MAYVYIVSRNETPLRAYRSPADAIEYVGYEDADAVLTLQAGWTLARESFTITPVEVQ